MPVISAIGETIHNYIWEAIYRDGNILIEHDGGNLDLPSRSFNNDAPRRDVERMIVLPTVPGIQPHVVWVPEGATVSFSRTHKIITSSGLEIGRTTIALVKWELGEQTMYHHFFEDGSVSIAPHEVNF